MRFLWSVILLLCFSIPSFEIRAQSAVSNTTDYTIGIHEVKQKSIKLYELADKLQLDTATILKLNKFRSASKILVRGQKIKIPVYPKPAQEEKPSKKKETSDKSKKGKSNESKESSVQQQQSPAVTMGAYYDTKKDRNRLMLVDATLKLNRSLINGANASLDSLALAPEKVVNEKDMNQTLINMKRNRDRAILRPYIMHFRDSLLYEVKLLEQEKSTIEQRLKLTPPIAVQTDTVVAGTDTIIYLTALYDDERAVQKTVLDVKVDESELTSETSATKSGKKKPKQSNANKGMDTVIVIDLPSEVTILTPQPEMVKIEDTTTEQNIQYDKAVALIDPLEPVSGSSAPDTTGAEGTEALVRQGVRRIPSPSALTNTDSIRLIKAEFFLKRGQKALFEKNLKNAEAYFKKAIELAPDYFEARYAIAQFEEQNGQWQTALKLYRQAELTDSLHPELYVSIGKTYMQMKKRTEAFEAFSKAILLQPDNIEALMGRAAILTDWKKYDEAIVDYNKVLSSNLMYHYAYKARGNVRLMKKDFANAIDDFTRFLIFEETDPAAFYYRGLAKIGNDELLDGCMDLSTSAGMGYAAAEKAIKKSCE